jgi:hypothetical protein
MYGMIKEAYMNKAAGQFARNKWVRRLKGISSDEWMMHEMEGQE